MFENDFYTESDEPKSLKDTRKTCEELYKYLNKHFEYGIVKDGKLKTHLSNKDIVKYYRFQSPDEFEQHGGGICFDYVEYEEAWLKQHGITCRKFYLITETPPDYDTHTFVVIETEGKFIWVESSMKNSQGVHVFSKLRDLLKMAAWGCFRGSKNKEHLNGVKYSVFEYTNNHPKYGCEIGEYMDWMIDHGKWVFDDMTKKEQPQIVEEAATLSRRGVSGWKHTDMTYEEKKNFERAMSFSSEIVYLRKEMRHMTRREIIQRLASLYNKLAEIYDTIEEDYTEVPMRTSRLGFARRPRQPSMSHRHYIDRLIYEIRGNIVELNHHFNRDGAKIVIDKMMDVWEYERRELHIYDHGGDKLVGNLTEKASHKILDKIMDSYVDKFYNGELYKEEVFEEAKLSSDDRKELDDSQFGIPELRKYPLTDKKHVLQAVRFFNKAPDEYKEELAKNIVKRAKELGMDWESWESLKPYLDNDKDNDEVVEESWQDRKNGINSHSKKQFFHVSFDDSFHNKTLYPRIPSYIANGKYDESEDNKYKENTTTKRICGSASIEGCLQAIMNNGDRIHLAGKELYVYVPEKPLSEYKIKTNKEIIEDKDVFDANLTGEMWILEPCKMKLYGTIVVDQISDKKEKPIVGDKDTKLNKYTFEWRWQVKPKAMDMGYADWEDDKNKITKVEKFPFDKVYFGTHERWNQNGLDLDRPLFVTPYKRLASIFSCVHDHKQMQISKHLDEQGIKPNDGKAYTYNLGYDEWNNMNQSNQNEYVDIVHVRVEGFPDLKEYTVNATGYVYEIDVSHLKDHIGRYDWMSKGKEFLIYDVDHVDGKENKLNIKCIIKGYPKNEKIHQEAVDINSLRQQCGEVFQQASQIHYGCLDENGERITASPFKDSWKMISTYHSQSIQSMEQSKLGVCFEHSFYVAKLLKDHGLPCQTFFLNCNIDHNQPQEETEDIQQESESISIEQHNMNNMSFWHQFTIVPNDTDSIVLIETSLTPEKNGVFLVRNMDDAVQHLIQTFGLNLSSQDFEVMKQDLIDVSTFEPRDGDTYIGYIDQAYLNGKFIKNEIRINHQTKTMKTYWDYLKEHGYLSEDGVKINEQIQQMDDNTAFDIINLLNANQLFTEDGLKFHQAFFTQDKPQLSVSEMESQLKGFVQESYLPNRTNNTLKEKYHYIPLTPQSKKKYQDQGVFRFGLRKTNVDNDTKGAIYIDENHIVVGYVAIKKKMNGQRWITALEVSEEFQGHHYGIDLLQIAVDDFGAEYLSVNKKNKPAIHMYHKYGWSTYDETAKMFLMKLQEGNDLNG